VVVVLSLAVRTHSERSHSRLRPIVRYPLDDSEARATVGAIDKRITIASVNWIEKLSLTVGAKRNIGWHQGASLCLVAAGLDHEALVADRGEIDDLHLLYLGQRWSLGPDIGGEAVQRFALNLDDDALAGIENPAIQLMLLGQAIDEGAKPHSLHHATHSDPRSGNHA